MIDVHYASLTSQGVQHRVFYRDGNPSRYQPRPTVLNYGEQTGTGVFPLVIAVPPRKNKNIMEKAECLKHYSCETSKKEIMVVGCICLTQRLQVAKLSWIVRESFFVQVTSIPMPLTNLSYISAIAFVS